MNEHQRRRILIGFEQLDRCLAEAWSIVASAERSSPFSKYVADASPSQIRALRDYVSRFRSAVLRILEELGFAPDEPRVSALWSFRASLVSAQVMLDELDGRHLRGYGALAPHDEKRLREALTELRDMVRKMAALAEERPGEDMESRLRRLETGSDEVQLLRDLGRVIEVHGLVELRATLSLLLERAESKSLEVAVFGRVSSGKSSLLNYILGTNVLPVGVTPVTAVPIRISYGAKGRLRIHFAQRPVLDAELHRLHEFASEEGNPGNEKLVTAVRVELPAACLKSGVTLVDTPGIGALATAGAEETKAYLPRCDLGIVLVDAASNLEHEDLDLVQALSQRGSRVMVLASKVDLLASEDRRRVIDYVERHLESGVGAAIAAYPVSVVGPYAWLATAWYEEKLLPILEGQKEQAELSVRRKLGALREAAVSSLRLRLEARRGATPSPRPDRASIDRLLRGASERIETARWRSFEILDALGADASEILEETTASVADRIRSLSG